MTDLAPLLRRIADYAAAYRAGVAERPHRPGISSEEAQARFDAPVPERGAAIDDVILQVGNAGNGSSDFDPVIEGRDPPAISAAA